MKLITSLQYNSFSYELRLFLKAGANIQPPFKITKLFLLFFRNFPETKKKQIYEQNSNSNHYNEL